jgi:hypothetical protein
LSLGMDSPTPTKPAGTPQWIVLVARDQPDIFAHLVQTFGKDDQVEVILDRRRDPQRNPPGVEERLRIHGVVVVRRSMR